MAIKAGADILADPPHLPTAYRAVLEAVRDGSIKEERIDESAERILRLKERLGLLDEAVVDPGSVAEILGSEANEQVAQLVGDGSVTVLRDRRGWLPLRPRWTVQLTGWNDAGGRQLERELRASGRTVKARWTGPRPSRRQIRAVVRGTRDHDVTVVVTSHLGAHPRQLAFVERLLRARARVIVVSASSPYDVMWFPRAEAHIATYGSVPASMRALARIVDGDLAPSGTLPVRIPHPGRPGTALFPFGSGKTW
jgi:beta-N-acetylhexosaminidase